MDHLKETVNLVQSKINPPLLEYPSINYPLSHKDSIMMLSSASLLTYKLEFEAIHTNISLNKFVVHWPMDISMLRLNLMKSTFSSPDPQSKAKGYFIQDSPQSSSNEKSSIANTGYNSGSLCIQHTRLRPMDRCRWPYQPQHSNEFGIIQRKCLYSYRL